MSKSPVFARADWPIWLAGLLLILWQSSNVALERNLLNRLDFLLYDLRMAVTASEPLAQQRREDPGLVAIVDVDETSLKKLGRWPWSRFKLARMAEAMHEAGAVVVAWDVVFSEPEPIVQEDVIVELETRGENTGLLKALSGQLSPDLRFAEVLSEGDHVLGAFFHFRDEGETGLLPGGWPDFPENHVLPRAQGYTAPLIPLTASSGGVGFVTTVPDADGVIRRTPLMIDYKGGVFPSLGLSAALRYLLLDRPTSHFAQVGDISSLTGIELTDTTITTDASGRVLIPYPALNQRVVTLPAWQVVEGENLAEVLEGRIVFVGTSSIGLADLISTPLTNVFPGVEVHALVAQHLIQGRFPSRPDWEPGATLVLQILLLAALMVVLKGRSAPIMTLLAVLIILGLTGLNFWAWSSRQLDLPLATSLLLIVVCYIGCLLRGFLIESQRRQQIHGMFGQYVPAAHIDQMLNQPEAYSMEGESRELTVLFSDIRSFTTISEQLSASELKALLNEYFNPVTELIFRNDGTIDKYVGDMVMAFWGAPIEDPDHRRKAVLTALAMQTLTKSLSDQLQAKGLPEIRIGVGLNTGVMNVGDMGSRYRKAYTVLGDAVNLGSRLESLTKYYGVGVLIGEQTKQGLDPEMAFRFCDRLQVKGKDEPVEAWEPLGLRSELDAQTLSRLDRYHTAINHYFERAWSEAKDILATLHQEDPGCRVYSLFLERIDTLTRQGVPDDWDGVWRHTSK